MKPEFVEFPKLYRLSRKMIITEKIDGTNGVIHIDDDLKITVGSRNRWISIDDDNYGFAKWVEERKHEIVKLGPGRHFGEFWGQGIQRRYGLNEKRFSLFNVQRWEHNTIPSCLHVVPILYHGDFDSHAVDECIAKLRDGGSVAAPGFMDAEGVVVWHVAANMGFKKTIKKDEEHKFQQKEAKQ